MRDLLQRLYDHMLWADARVLDLLERTSPELGATGIAEPMRLFAHVLGAERVWYVRIAGEHSATHPIWPNWSLEEITAAAAGNRTDYQRLIESLTPDKLERVIEYKNSQGTSFSTRLSDILLHVATHGCYHRGQIAAGLRKAGAEPVNTDYITYVRTLPSPSSSS